MLCDYSAGQEFTWDFQILDSELKLFSGLSRDDSPVHIDREFARSLGFNDRLVHAGLLVAKVSELIGKKLPDQYCVCVKIDLAFPNPAYEKVMYTFNARIINVSESVGLVEFAVTITDLKTCKPVCKGIVNALHKKIY